MSSAYLHQSKNTCCNFFSWYEKHRDNFFYFTNKNYILILRMFSNCVPLSWFWLKTPYGIFPLLGLKIIYCTKHSPNKYFPSVYCLEREVYYTSNSLHWHISIVDTRMGIYKMGRVREVRAMFCKEVKRWAGASLVVQ